MKLSIQSHINVTILTQFDRNAQYNYSKVLLITNGQCTA